MTRAIEQNDSTIFPLLTCVFAKSRIQDAWETLWPAVLKEEPIDLLRTAAINGYLQVTTAIFKKMTRSQQTMPTQLFVATISVLYMSGPDYDQKVWHAFARRNPDIIE